MKFDYFNNRLHLTELETLELIQKLSETLANKQRFQSPMAAHTVFVNEGNKKHTFQFYIEN